MGPWSPRAMSAVVPGPTGNPAAAATPVAEQMPKAERAAAAAGLSQDRALYLPIQISGCTVTPQPEVIQSRALPSDVSAQKVELISVTELWK